MALCERDLPFKSRPPPRFEWKVERLGETYFQITDVVGIRCVVLEVRSRRFGKSVQTVCSYDPEPQRFFFC